MITFKYLLSLLKVNYNGQTEIKGNKSDNRSKRSIRQLHKSETGIKGQRSKGESRTDNSRIWTRLRARKRSILQGNECQESTEGNKQQTIDNKVVTNPLSIFYHKAKITITLIQLIDAFDSSPSFVITMFRLIWHTWRNAKILDNNGEIDIK